MNRRPRLLVLLAFAYCVAPFIYPLFVSLYFGTPLAVVAKETLDSNSTLRNVETFVFPIALGIFAYFARRVSYFVVVIGSVYLLARNFFVFASTESLPLSGLVGMNLLFVFVIVYLSRKSTRAIYFNAKMRWWETDPRYVVDWDANLARLGALPEKAKIRNIAIGGAAIETDLSGFHPHEMVHIEFKHAGKDYRFPAGVVWEQTPGKLVGIQWIDAKKSADWQRIKGLIQELKAKRTPTTRPKDWWDDFKAWASRSEMSE